MTLRSRAFEQATRRLVKSELAGSKSLRREYRRHRRKRWNQHGRIVWLVFLGVFAPVGVALKAMTGAKENAGWALLSLGLTGIALCLGLGLRTRLEQAHQHWPVTFLPLPKRDYVRFLLREFGRILAFWWIAVVSTHVYLGATHLTWTEAALGAMGQGCVLVLVAVVSAAILTSRQLSVTGLSALLMAVALYIWNATTRHLPPGLAQCLLTATPAGWVILLLQDKWLPSAGLAALAAAMPWATQRLRALSETEPVSLADWRLSATALADEDGEAAPPAEALVAPVELRDVEERILRREFLEPSPLASSGGDVLERMANRLLSEREKLVAEFLLGGTPGWWTRHWQRAAVVTLIGVVGAVALPWGQAWWLALAGAVVSMFLAGPVLGGHWPLLAWHGWVPVGYWEILRVLVKVNTVRVAVWLPLLAASGAAIAVRVDLGATAGALFGCKLALLCWWMQPVAFVLHVSSATSDTAQIRVGGVLATVGFFALVVVLFVAGGMELAPWPFPLIGIMAGTAAAWVVAALYGCGYNRVAFDARPR